MDFITTEGLLRATVREIVDKLNTWHLIATLIASLGASALIAFGTYFAATAAGRQQRCQAAMQVKREKLEQAMQYFLSLHTWAQQSFSAVMEIEGIKRLMLGGAIPPESVFSSTRDAAAALRDDPGIRLAAILWLYFPELHAEINPLLVLRDRFNKKRNRFMRALIRNPKLDSEKAAIYLRKYNQRIANQVPQYRESFERQMRRLL